MKKFFLFTLLFTALASCNSNLDQTKSIKVKNQYSLDIPEALNKVTNLNDDASLQYQNPLKELYIIVIDETKESVNNAISLNNLDETYTPDINGYSELLLSNYMDGEIELKQNPVLRDTIINGLKSKVTDIEGNSEGYDIYWKAAYIEGKNNYYQVLAWTLGSKKEEHKNIMRKMLESFKETDKSRKK